MVAIRDTPGHSVLFLDTATKYTGYALFNTVDHKYAYLYQYGLLRGGPGHVTQRSYQIAHKALGMLEHFKPVCVVQEFPTYQSGIRGNQAMRSGDTLMLARLCGMIEIMAWSYDISHIYMYFTQWNGQLPKAVTCNRLKTYLGIDADPSSIENNYADAIMMGRYTLMERDPKHTVSIGETAPVRQDY